LSSGWHGYQHHTDTRRKQRRRTAEIHRVLQLQPTPGAFPVVTGGCHCIADGDRARIEPVMPVANYEKFCEMLERARSGRFAYPAINVTSLTTANAVLKGLAESRSDGFIQVSTGGGAFASGAAVKDMALGAISIAEHVHRVADRYPIYVALHTDHCQADKLDSFVLPLVEETERRRAAGRPNLFNSHMFDGSALPLKENLDIAVRLLERFRKSELILEIEAGVVGGEEDGVKASAAAKLYTTPEDTLEVARRLNAVGGARYLLAATFGNVHGVYKPGQVKLRPSILKECQDAVVSAFGEASRFHLVFHGGSGSALQDIHEALDYGVVKMNIDTDMQYVFTRAVADHCFKNYDGVLRVDGEVGRKNAYDPRAYLALAEKAMAERVKQAVHELRATGTTLMK
jgi:fructose-bisphosphate aldolase class II